MFRIVTLRVSSLRVSLLVLALASLMLSTAAQAQTASFSYAIAALGGGFNNPSGVAVDGSGNVYVADSGYNAVKEMPAGCASSSCVTTLGGGFNYPAGVAVDGSGNVYVADTDNSEVKKMPAGCASSSCVTTLGGGFLYPISVAVDGIGNVYVADQGNSAVKEMAAGCASSSCVKALGGGFSYPQGVAVDGSGNVYVGDYNNSAVKEMAAGCASSSCVKTLGGGFGGPTGVAVDSSGNVYVEDSYNSAVEEMPAGCASSSCVTTLGGGFTYPFGVAVDGSGNVYIGDQGNNAVDEIMTRGVNFLTVPVGSASAAIQLTFTFESAGSLSSATPYLVLTQGAKNLDFNAAATQGSNVCNGTTTYAAGDTCTVNVTFTPTKAGPRNGAVELLNAGGSTITKIYISGTGTGPQIVFSPATQSTLGGGFSYPGGVAVDGSGNLYVADSANSAVKEMPAGCASSSCVTTLGGGFNSPQSVAVDGSGNVYVADFGNNAVKEMPAGCASSSCVTTLGGGFSYPSGVAVDGSGNVYVADISKSAKEMPAGCASSSCVTKLGGGFSGLFGVAVDGSGNVYISDFGVSAVAEIPAGCTSSSCVTDLGGGAFNSFNSPQGVAVDGSGNVYVADSGNNEVYEMPAGCVSSNCVTTLGSGFSGPYGVALDGSGNVYVADSGNNAVKELNRAAPPSLSFTPTTVGSTSSDSPQTAQVANIGNQSLIFTALSYAADFTEASGDASACTSSTSLASGQQCDLPIQFAPLTSGSLIESVSITTNALNVSGTKQSIAVGGTGIAITSQAITFTDGLPVSASYSAGLTYTLSATGGGSGNPVLFSRVSGPGSVSGNTLTITGVGTVVVAANQAGNSSYSAAPQGTQSILITSLTTPAVLTSPTPGSTLTASPVTFTWTTGTGATEYAVSVGDTSKGSYNLYRSPTLRNQTSISVSLPINGETLYVSLCSFINSTWQCNYYNYSTSGTPVLATLTSPAPGSTLTSSSATFQWSPGSGVSGYILALSATNPGSHDLYSGTSTTATSATVTGLPTNGLPIYARLYSHINGSWAYYNDYVLNPEVPATLASPTSGTTLAATGQVFSWAPVTGATGYTLYLGTSAGGGNLLDAHTTATTVTAGKLPAGTIYARLWTNFNGVWKYNDYSFTAK
jgi:sugar lactone lactonase YvrE